MSDPDAEAYAAELTRKREEKDEFFAEHPQSPIPPEEREDFSGLAYYDPDTDYRVEATVHVDAEPDPVEMETTADTVVRYLRVATLEFDLGGDTFELAAYRQEGGEDDTLFVPFRDKTTGQQTYRLGRYMELEPESGTVDDGQAITLDFNIAYNPFCAYSDTFACPLPPEENWLETTIEAGERDEA